jgi:hypothetical protein
LKQPDHIPARIGHRCDQLPPTDIGDRLLRLCATVQEELGKDDRLQTVIHDELLCLI